MFAISDTDGNIQINTVPNDSPNSGSLLNCSRSIDKDRAFNFNFEYQNLKRKSVLRRIDNIDSMDRFYLYCHVTWNSVAAMLMFYLKHLKNLLLDIIIEMKTFSKYCWGGCVSNFPQSLINNQLKKMAIPFKPYNSNSIRRLNVLKIHTK